METSKIFEKDKEIGKGMAVGQRYEKSISP